MNESPERLNQLASLPPGHPDRRELEREITLMKEEDRTAWLNQMKETDLLYEGLPQIEVPPDLEARLLKLPGMKTAPVGRIYSRRLRLYAASLLILLPIAGYVYWTMPRTDMVPDYHFLAPPLASDVASLAVQIHEAPPPLAIASSDSEKVQTTLDAEAKSYAMPFPSMLPKPKTPLQLQGGGVCAFGPTHAIFTRWTAGSTTYTLYQFDGKPLAISAGFSKTIVSTAGHYRVSIWPGYGNPCTWALVLENKSAVEAFD